MEAYMKAHSNPILSSVIEVSEKLKGSKLNDSVLKEIDEPINILADFLNLDKTEVVFFVLFFSLEHQDDKNITLHRVAEYLEYPFLNLLAYRYVIDSLENKSLIHMTERNNVSHHPENNGYRVAGTVSNCVIEGKTVISPRKKQKTLEDIISEIMFIETYHSVMDDIEYVRQIELLEQNNQEVTLIKNITSMFPDDFDSRVLLYYFCYSMLFGGEAWEPRYHRNKLATNAFAALPKSSLEKRRWYCNNNNDILIEKQLIEKYQSNNVSGDGTFSSFRLTKKGIKVIFGKDGKKFSYNDELSELDSIISGIKEIAAIYEEKKPLGIKKIQFEKVEKRYCKYGYFRQVKNIISDEVSRFIYYDCVNDYINGYESVVSRTLKDIFGQGPDYFNELRSLINEKHFLVDSGLIEINQNEIVEKATMNLADKSIELLYEENSDLYKKKSVLKNVLRPEDLKLKDLFYEVNVQNQIDMLYSSLSQDNLMSIQKRLEEKGLTKGIAVILYGAPGTGKTETVYQLAKKTNRKIMHVDISESKSMWFGESEKCIKNIFSNYKSLCKSCKGHKENTPILLFNEADAIISKRGTVDGGGPRQTENAMQNILLEEIEKLEGILIATSNLCENMDVAFERRFLFKIKFEKPSIEARSKIWMNKLNSISNDDAVALAKQFDFSGGEIDNIVRKCEMNEIISGSKPNYEQLVDLCRQERLEKEGERRIGFF